MIRETVIDKTINSCPYDSSNTYDPHDSNRITSYYDQESDKYFCEVPDGYCFENSHWMPKNQNLNQDGYPCHERNCSSELYSVKGCAKKELSSDGYDHMCR